MSIKNLVMLLAAGLVCSFLVAFSREILLGKAGCVLKDADGNNLPMDYYNSACARNRKRAAALKNDSLLTSSNDDPVETKVALTTDLKSALTTDSKSALMTDSKSLELRVDGKTDVDTWWKEYLSHHEQPGYNLYVLIIYPKSSAKKEAIERALKAISSDGEDVASPEEKSQDDNVKDETKQDEDEEDYFKLPLSDELRLVIIVLLFLSLINFCMLVRDLKHTLFEEEYFRLIDRQLEDDAEDDAEGYPAVAAMAAAIRDEAGGRVAPANQPAGIVTIL